jgi:hypothetical protein
MRVANHWSVARLSRPAETKRFRCVWPLAYRPRLVTSSGEYGALLVSGNYLCTAQAGPYSEVYNINTGALWFAYSSALAGELFKDGELGEALGAASRTF